MYIGILLFAFLFLCRMCWYGICDDMYWWIYETFEEWALDDRVEIWRLKTSAYWWWMERWIWQVQSQSHLSHAFLSRFSCYSLISFLTFFLGISRIYTHSKLTKWWTEPTWHFVKGYFTSEKNTLKCISEARPWPKVKGPTAQNIPLREGWAFHVIWSQYLVYMSYSLAREFSVMSPHTTSRFQDIIVHEYHDLPVVFCMTKCAHWCSTPYHCRATIVCCLLAFIHIFIRGFFFVSLTNRPSTNVCICTPPVAPKGRFSCTDATE